MHDNDFDDGGDWYDEDDDGTTSDRNYRRRSNVMRTPENTRKVVPMWNGQPVTQMESSHVMAAILWCERKFVAARDAHYKCHGEGSNFYFASVGDMYPDYGNLRVEWARRNE